jgi:hypothetical protein
MHIFFHSLHNSQSTCHYTLYISYAVNVERRHINTEKTEQLNICYFIHLASCWFLDTPGCREDIFSRILLLLLLHKHALVSMKQVSDVLGEMFISKEVWPSRSPDLTTFFLKNAEYRSAETILVHSWRYRRFRNVTETTPLTDLIYIFTNKRILRNLAHLDFRIIANSGVCVFECYGPNGSRHSPNLICS